MANEATMNEEYGAISGDLYVQFQNEDVEKEINKYLTRTLKTRKGMLVVEEGKATPFDQVCSVLLRPGVSRTFYISNATTRAMRECRNRSCPMESRRDSCVLQRKSCATVIVRPDCNSADLQAMFPGDGVLGLMGSVWDCPHRPNGAVLNVLGFVWLPKCERRSYEVTVNGRVFENDGTSAFFNRGNNAMRAPLFERLEPISLRTTEKLSSWLDYLNWRQHLLMATKVGIRYLATRIDPRRHALVFTVVAENRASFMANRFWERREPVYACPTSNSRDAWNYRELSYEECRERDIRKAFGVELGDFETTMPREDLCRQFRAAAKDCPWTEPYLADVYFQVEASVIEDMEAKLGNSPSPEEVVEFIAQRLKLPMPGGFLTLSSTGDEVLISRQRRAILDFGRTGSVAAPFLSTYLFDVSQARVPTTVEMPEFLNPNLNEGQKQAVATMLAAPDLALVQGPPGTGKTTVIAEALWQFTRQGKRVLVVSQSGAAVDNALDRLANIPGIRAIRLQKERKGDYAADEESRYSKGNALANFYQTLGETARRRLTEWNDMSARLRSLEQCRTRLAGLVDRLAAEDQLIAGGGEAAAQAFAAVENESIPVLLELERMGIGVFDPVYNRNWSAAEKRLSLQGAMDVVRRCRDELLPRILEDATRLRGLSGDSVVSDEAALQLTQLKGRAEALQQRMDAEADDEVYAELSREYRQLRREIVELGKSSGFATEFYERFFTCPDEDGREVKSMLAEASRHRLELLQLLEALASRLEATLDRLEATDLRRFEGRLRDIDEKVEVAKHRREPFAREIAGVIAEARRDLQLQGETPAAALDWCDGEIVRVRTSLDSTLRERALLGPIYQGWLEQLAHPDENDEERVLADYIDSCSIVGVTCTSDTRILEQNGFDHFDVVIIDEVSKATPPELLMSMVKAEKAILVGDHRQLPPLFGDREPLAMEEIMERDEEDGVDESRRVTRANFKKYERMVGASLFKEYFEQAPDALKSTLWEQYRMHPDIMQLVNAFYDNRLKCGLTEPGSQRNHLLDRRLVPWMKNPGHAYWIDSTRAPDGKVFEEEQSGSSKVNRLEVALIRKALLDMDKGLDAHAQSIGQPGLRKTVGVIAFYGHQKRLLRRELQKLKLKHMICRVDTVDRFQGQERDYVLVSMTRNKVHLGRHGCSANSYVAKFERINVAFSRARELLLVFGARDMFVDCEVNLPPLLRAGATTRQPVYRRMIEGLEAQGLMVNSIDLLDSNGWEDALPEKSHLKSPMRRKSGPIAA